MTTDYQTLNKQFFALIHGVPRRIANLANATALFYGSKQPDRAPGGVQNDMAINLNICQKLALAAAPGITGLNVAVFSVGSGGTDDPTDAAGGYTDGDTLEALKAQGVFPVLAVNDACHAPKAVDGLIITNPTGTNVNDVAVVLLPAHSLDQGRETAHAGASTKKLQKSAVNISNSGSGPLDYLGKS